MILRLAVCLATVSIVLPPPGAAQGKIEIAVPLAELQKRVQADSNDPAAHYNVALGYWQAKKWDDVDRELRAAIALQPRFAEAHLALAFVPFARDRHMLDDYTSDKNLPENIKTALKQRTDEYRRAFVIDPMVDLRIIAANTVDLDYRLKDYFFGTAVGKYVDGLTQCQEGKYADCENTLAEVILELGRNKPSDVNVPSDAYWYRGIAAAHVKHFDVAIGDFTRLIARDQAAVAKAEEKGLVRSPIRTNEYRYFLALFQQAAGKSDEAIAGYKTVAENDLGLYMAHVHMAEIYEAQKGASYALAVAERRNAVNANPDDPSLQMDLGVTIGKAGQFAEAEAALKAAIDGLPRDPTAWYWFGIAEQVLGKKPEAKVAFEHVVALAPSRMQDLVAKARQRLGTLQ